MEQNSIILRFHGRTEVDQFFVMIHDRNLLEEYACQYIISILDNNTKNHITNMTEDDYLTLELENHPVWLTLYTWIILKKPSWIVS